MSMGSNAIMVPLYWVTHQALWCKRLTLFLSNFPTTPEHRYHQHPDVPDQGRGAKRGDGTRHAHTASKSFHCWNLYLYLLLYLALGGKVLHICTKKVDADSRVPRLPQTLLFRMASEPQMAGTHSPLLLDLLPDLIYSYMFMTSIIHLQVLSWTYKYIFYMLLCLSL